MSIGWAMMSGRSGHAPASCGWIVQGRRLANTCMPLRRASRPFSGRRAGSTPSHFGPPTLPMSTASAALHLASVSSVSGKPKASMDAPPSAHSSKRKVWPYFAATFSSTLTACATISGPM